MAGTGRGANPLAHVLAALGEPLDLLKYNDWSILLPEGRFLTTASSCCSLAVACTASRLPASRRAAHRTLTLSPPVHNRCLQVGAEQFCEVLREVRGPEAVAEWRHLQVRGACWWDQHSPPACLLASSLFPHPTHTTHNSVLPQEYMRPLAKAATALPPVAFRQDVGALRTALLRYAPHLLASAPSVGQLTGPFSKVRERVCVCRLASE